MLGHTKEKVATNNCFIFESWFYLKRSDDYGVGVGDDFIGFLKTNTKGFCKENMKNLTMGWPGGFYMVLKINTMVTGDTPIIAIGTYITFGRLSLYLYIVDM